MNAVSWLVHVGVLTWCWPLIRSWWSKGGAQGRWSVVASLLLPIVAWVWLVPTMVRLRQSEREERQAQWVARRNEQRARDIAFWREQARTGDLASTWLAIDLLALWGVPAFEPEPLPGAHAYSSRCACRNCERARLQAPQWILS